jgi:hypothetical protein
MTDFESPMPDGRCLPGCPTCADLRRAAVALVASVGLEGSTCERLGQVAGLSSDALDAHACGDVDVCVRAAYAETMEGLQARFAARLHRAATREEGLRAATADLLDYLARHGDVAAFVTVEVLKGGRDLLELRLRPRLSTVLSFRRVRSS